MTRTPQLALGLLLAVALAACGDATTLTGPEAEAAIVEAQSRVEAGSTLRIHGTPSDRPPPAIYLDGERVQGDAEALLGQIEPKDIERIEVKKGCHAVGLLGGEGRGGIIFIYTKAFDGEDLELEFDEERWAACDELSWLKRAQRRHESR